MVIYHSNYSRKYRNTLNKHNFVETPNHRKPEIMEKSTLLKINNSSSWLRSLNQWLWGLDCLRSSGTKSEEKAPNADRSHRESPEKKKTNPSRTGRKKIKPFFVDTNKHISHVISCQFLQVTRRHHPTIRNKNTNVVSKSPSVDPDPSPDIPSSWRFFWKDSEGGRPFSLPKSI